MTSTLFYWSLSQSLQTFRQSRVTPIKSYSQSQALNVQKRPDSRNWKKQKKSLNRSLNRLIPTTTIKTRKPLIPITRMTIRRRRVKILMRMRSKRKSSPNRVPNGEKRRDFKNQIKRKRRRPSKRLSKTLKKSQKLLILTTTQMSRRKRSQTIPTLTQRKRQKLRKRVKRRK